VRYSLHYRLWYGNIFERDKCLHCHFLACVLDALVFTLNYVTNQGFDINSIFINSSVRNYLVNDQSQSQAENSNHWITNKNAIDINMVNNVSVINMGCNSLAQAFQNGLDAYSKIWENFGPCYEHKAGNNNPVPEDHSNHFHISGNGFCS